MLSWLHSHAQILVLGSVTDKIRTNLILRIVGTEAEELLHVSLLKLPCPLPRNFLSGSSAMKNPTFSLPARTLLHSSSVRTFSITVSIGKGEAGPGAGVSVQKRPQVAVLLSTILVFL